MIADGLKTRFDLGEAAAYIVSLEPEPEPKLLTQAVTELLASSFVILSRTRPMLLGRLGNWSDNDMTEWAGAMSEAIIQRGGSRC